MFYQFFLSRQVKRSAIISYKHGIYDLPYKLQKYRLHRWAGLSAHTRKKKCLELEATAQLAGKLRIIVLLNILQINFAKFREFVSNALSKILTLRNWCLLLSIGVNYFTQTLDIFHDKSARRCL